MDVELLSRIQFGFTVAFHYLFPPLSIGLGLALVFMEAQWLRTGDEKFLAMTKFWMKIFGLIFAIGVASGIVMEFQFGMNWAAYSRFVGDVFGSALAAEGIFAFFLESGFLAIALFAAFPEVYATVFSGFYVAFFLFLAALIFRAVAIEFRSKLPMTWWRTTWDVSFSVGSLIAALLLGVALGNIAWGIPLDERGVFVGTFFGLLHPYALLTGVTTVALFVMHGSIYWVFRGKTRLTETSY
jgi:cytochrome d oxidase subunit CydB